MWTDFFHLFYFFLIYSFMGWCMETCLVSFNSKEFVNRGFLNGPLCPIYGTGATAIYLCLQPLKDHLLAVFLGGMVLATAIEYLTSLVMEQAFHARWWDYSDKKFNLQGRICLSISLCWGLLSVIMLEVFHPIVLFIVNQIPVTLGKIVGWVIIILVSTDLFVTVKHVLSLNNKLEILTQMRNDFIRRVESSMLYSTAEEARSRLESLSSSEVLEEIGVKLANRVDSKIESIERLSQDLKNFREQRGYHLNLKSFVEKRLLKAFPNFQSISNQRSLEELKKHWNQRK
ncbi:MAG: putative ABC transporter permease [Erysipelotrichaceae bacterium]|nr:putative ABC transporter permease [Erysipelotrichaceae bacterium]